MLPYQVISVDLTPDGRAPRPMLNASQYDNGRPVMVNLTMAGDAYELPEGAEAWIDVRKPSGKIVHEQVEVTSGQSFVEFALLTQMTAEPGAALMELSIVDDDQDPIGTANWLMMVEMSPLHAGDSSETWVRDIDDAIAEAKEYAETSGEYAETAEAWAVGQRGGVDVEEDDETYENNSKYWAEVAQQGAEFAGYALFDIDDSTGEMIVTVATNLSKEVTFAINEETGELEVALV